MSYPDPVYFGDTGEMNAILRPATADAHIVITSRSAAILFTCEVRSCWTTEP